MRRWSYPIFALALLMVAGAGLRDGIDSWVDATRLPPLLRETSVQVRGQDGTLLRAYTVDDGRWRLPVTLDDVDPDYVAMLVRYEDKRFHTHRGVDPVALLRAAGQAATSGEIVSGGSTLTMQVARLLEDGPTGSWSGKLRQMRLALALERRMTKDEILALYLNHAPFGGNLEGVGSASYAYFGKPPARLTADEAALLVALPQSPEARRPDRNPGAARAARDRVLARMVGAGVVAEEDRSAALREEVPRQRQAFPALAPHLADRALAERPLSGQHDLTVDAGLQARLEALASEALHDQGPRMQIALLVADHRTGEVLASVGSAGFQADSRQGFVDMTRAPRSPGSTLKPLVYGLAFDRGLAHPETLIADVPVDFDGYRPENFDGLFRGDIRVRRALQLSLNIPVVVLTEALGPANLMAGLRRSGARPELPEGQPGLAVSLGGIGLSLEDLVTLYAGIANGGTARPLVWRRGDSVDTPQRIMGEVPAWQVADILLETPRPIGVQSAGIAFKTGTSYGHRDAWAIGFDGRHVVGVWMGRPDGTPVPGAFGGELAAPVLFAAFERVKPAIDPIDPPPPATLLVSTAQLPAPLRRFGGAEAMRSASPSIAFPPDGAVIEGPLLAARVEAGTAPFTWLANGKPVGQSRNRQITLPHLGAGYSSLTVIDAEGRSAAATINLR